MKVEESSTCSILRSTLPWENREMPMIKQSCRFRRPWWEVARGFAKGIIEVQTLSRISVHLEPEPYLLACAL
jgi:hypothetical protein